MALLVRYPDREGGIVAATINDPNIGPKLHRPPG